MAVRSFAQNGQSDAIVTLSKPTAQKVADYLCSDAAPQVRLVRCTAPDGQIRVLATNLPASDFPAEVFAELYHKRWRIEEAFKRLKHQVKLESVSGLTQHSGLVDVHAKVLADNLTSLVCMGATEAAALESAKRTCNRSYASRCLQRLMLRMVMGLGCFATLLDKAFLLLGANSNRVAPGRSNPRLTNQVKPHPSLA